MRSPYFVLFFQTADRYGAIWLIFSDRLISYVIVLLLVLLGVISYSILFYNAQISRYAPVIGYKPSIAAENIPVGYLIRPPVCQFVIIGGSVISLFSLSSIGYSYSRNYLRIKYIYIYIYIYYRIV